ncbi:MarR family winged helix-turn-helix transcriptional regulator [Aromatoleum petrolei]|uniref:MarR family transcriptional regulator n=1 Tax=Aromatoleum petrolei TaxID=76116 RepID=A0ABX1MQ77_9RHOO|nr:MarR family transcriptional regulator [Aromatoleum petrolei]NMF88274.1 MarR family transcriptional regulator [Aromatoleum petrolei]QTQ38029.1 Transcriptional regulator, MarR family [Aromatoleum petrolei]
MALSEISFTLLLADAARLMRHAFVATLEDSPLTLARARVLIHLERNEGIRQVALAERLEIQPMTLVRMIDQLAGEGLVERRSDPADRRAHQLYLTDAARPQLEIIARVGAAVREKALAGMTEAERAQTIALVERICRNLAAE